MCTAGSRLHPPHKPGMRESHSSPLIPSHLLGMKLCCSEKKAKLLNRSFGSCGFLQEPSLLQFTEPQFRDDPVFQVKVARSCPTLCDPMDCTVHGILQARILEWVVAPFSRGSSQQGSNPGLPHCRHSLPAEPQGKPHLLRHSKLSTQKGSG